MKRIVWILFLVALGLFLLIIHGCNISTEKGLSAQDNQNNSNPPQIGPPPGLSQNPPPIPIIKDAIASSDKVEISWSDDSPYEDGFIIKKDGIEVGRTDRNISVWTDTSIFSEKTYCYAVIAYNKEWITSPSPEKCVTIPTPPPTQDPPVIDPSPTHDSPKLLVSPTGFGECGPVTTDWILFDDKPYVIWWTSDEPPCIGPEKSYLSIFAKNSADAVEVSRIELSALVIWPLSIVIGDGTIYVGGGNGGTGLLTALDLNDKSFKWLVNMANLGGNLRGSSSGLRDVVVIGTDIFVTGDADTDAIFARFDRNGQYIWSEKWGTNCYDWGYKITPADGGGIDVLVKAGQMCFIFPPPQPIPSVSGDVILHYDY